MRKLKRSLLFTCLLALLALAPPPEKVTVYLIGDSTMADKRASAFPETGWGTPFKTFFDSSVVIENHARNGRSTRSFIAESLWQPIVEKLRAGDYVFIQFGHNDESKSKGERYATPEQYKANLKKFVAETRKKGASPVLLSPVTRRRFDDQGRIMETHAEYSPLVKEVALETKTPYIDLDAKSRELLQRFGKDFSKYLFLQLEPGEHPNYPEGRDDNTHFNELGARLVAQVVLSEIQTMDLELRNRIINKRSTK